MGAEWYYSQGGQKKGPVDSQQLRQLAKSGELHPDDLLWKDGMAEWKPAKEAKKLFEGVPTATPAASVAIATDQGADATTTDDGEEVPPSAKDTFVRTLGASALIAVATGIVLHTLQWLFGWGWGSLWSVLSTVVILSCGIFPWIRDHEGHKSPAAAFGAGVGAVLGAVYGWFTGGLLSGVLFCTSVGTWAAWLGNIRGLTSKAVQAGIVACTLTGFHVLGMLPPSSRVEQAGEDRPISDKEYEAIQIGSRKWDVQDTLGFPFYRDVKIHTTKDYGPTGVFYGTQYHETVFYGYRLKRQPDQMAMFVFKGTQIVDGSNPKLVEKGIVPRPQEK